MFAVAKGRLSSLTYILWKPLLHGYITALPKGSNQETVSLNVASDELNIGLWTFCFGDILESQHSARTAPPVSPVI